MSKFHSVDFCRALRYRSRELPRQRTPREKRRRGESERTSEVKRFCSKSKSRRAICVAASPRNRVSSVSPVRRGGRRQGREEERRKVELTTGARCSSSFPRNTATRGNPSCNELLMRSLPGEGGRGGCFIRDVRKWPRSAAAVLREYTYPTCILRWRKRAEAISPSRFLCSPRAASAIRKRTRSMASDTESSAGRCFSIDSKSSRSPRKTPPPP